MMIEAHEITINPSIFQRCDAYNLKSYALIQDGKVKMFNLTVTDTYQSQEEIMRYQRVKLSLFKIAMVTADHFNIQISDITGKCQAGDIMKARLIFCVMARSKTEMTLERIGLFINRDHATVRHAQKSIDRQRAHLNDEKNIWEHYLEIEHLLK